MSYIMEKKRSYIAPDMEFAVEIDACLAVVSMSGDKDDHEKPQPDPWEDDE